MGRALNNLTINNLKMNKRAILDFINYLIQKSDIYEER